MKRLNWISGTLFLSLLLLGMLWAGDLSAEAYTMPPTNPDIPRGGALYDNWFAAQGIQAPQGDMPLWTRQSTSTQKGPDTWRCITCHGWDYQGKEGAYRSGSNFTGFPGLLSSSQKTTPDQIVEQLKGKSDPAHNFSAYLNDADMKALATFLTTSLIDDSQYIDPITLSVKDGNSQNGRGLYDAQCSSCHGTNGQKIKFRFEGMDASIGTLAVLDPWRFLHKTRFGTPGTPMVIGYDLGWTAQEGRDVLYYAQSLPSGLEKLQLTPGLTGHETPPPKVGGPANNFFTSILTALGAMAVGLGFNILIAAFLVGFILLIVWAIRSRK
jgi:mono/diheme cytochrome c family protein